MRSQTWRFEERDPLSGCIAWRNVVDQRLAQWAEQQNDDGSFGGPDDDRVRVTALTALAFSLRGHTFDSGQHGELLRRAASWLIERQDETGRIVSSNAEPDRRTQAQATFALIDLSYSPDYPKFEYPGVMVHARRAVEQLDSIADDTDSDIWVHAARAYATRAALRAPRTQGGPAPGAKLDWPASVTRALTRQNTSEDGLRLRAELPADELMRRFLGRDSDDAFFATLAGAFSDAAERQRNTMHSWIAGGTVDGWEPVASNSLEFNRANLLRTLQIEATFVLLLPKERK